MDAKTPVSALPRACTCRIVQARTYPCQTRDGIHIVIEHNPSKCKRPAVKSTKGLPRAYKGGGRPCEEQRHDASKAEEKGQKELCGCYLAEGQYQGTMPTGARSKKNKTRAIFSAFASLTARYGHVSLHAGRKRANTSAARLAYPTQCQ